MKNLALLAVALFSLAAFTTTSLWKSDKMHSQLGFAVNHLGISEVHGYFTDFDATITSEKDDFSDAKITLKGNTNSIYTRVQMRDDHLKSPDFFDAQQYPTFYFQSTKIKSDGKNEYKVTGDLTIKGITKQVELELDFHGTTVNPQSKQTTAGFKIEGKINRLDFGVGTTFPDAMISNIVKIEAHGEFTK